MKRYSSPNSVDSKIINFLGTEKYSKLTVKNRMIYCIESVKLWFKVWPHFACIIGARFFVNGSPEYTLVEGGTIPERASLIVETRNKRL